MSKEPCGATDKSNKKRPHGQNFQGRNKMKPSTVVYARMSLTALQNNEVRKVKPQLKIFKNMVRFLEWKSSFRLYLQIHNKDFDEGTMQIRFTYWTKDVQSGEIIETHSKMYWDLTRAKEEVISEESKPKLRNYTWREDLGGWMKNEPETPELF